MFYTHPPTNNQCGIYHCWIVNKGTGSRYKCLSKDSDPRLLLLCVGESHKDCFSLELKSDEGGMLGVFIPGDHRHFTDLFT